jgi:hypothetical protein
MNKQNMKYNDLDGNQGHAEYDAVRRRIPLLLCAGLKSLSSDDIKAEDLGELAFVSDWTLARREQFASDLRDVVTHALATNNFDMIDIFLDASKPREAAGVIAPARVAVVLNSKAAIGDAQ